MMLQTKQSQNNNTISDPFADKISVKGKQWSLRIPDQSRIDKLVSGWGLPEVIARLMVLRDIDRKTDIDAFLTPLLSKHFPDPFKMHGMRGLAEFLADAIIDNKRIGIMADFDVDGATSYAVLTRFLKDVGYNDIPFFIPDRLNDGYGPSPKGFDSLKTQGAEIVIILDCGITAVEPIEYARSIGLQTIIVDHHEPDQILPEADYIIDPKLQQCGSNYDYMAAVGVTFMLCVALNATLRQKGVYESKKEPSLRHSLDLVALGTVCDMVPLIDANRLFVKYGFKMMAERQNHGLRALLSVSNITSLPDPYHAGFMLGPRINAGSRVHQSDLGARLLAAQSDDEAMRLAWLLDDCNEKRKALQKDMAREAMDKAKAMLIEYPMSKGLVLDGEGWHTGLSGLVAGAVKDRYEKPTCVVAWVQNEDGIMEGRASGRSVPGIHIADIFMSAQKEGLIVKGGGHAMAGGFTILKEQLEAFRVYFNEQIEAQMHTNDAYVTSNCVDIDTCLAVRSLNLSTARLLIESLSPFGIGNEEPVTVLSQVHIGYAEKMGSNHVKCLVKDCEGSIGLKAVAFKAYDSELGQFLCAKAGTAEAVHLYGQVKINEWNARQNVEFHISDAMTV